MIKNNLKIKENITLENIRDAVECVVSYAFKYGIYTPYYVETGKIVAVVRYLISGLQLEENETEYSAYLLDGQVRNIVNNYITKDPHNIFLNATDKIEFTKQRVIHDNVDLSKIVEFANVVIDSFGNFSKLDLSFATKENLKMTLDVLKKMKDAKTDLTPDTISEIVKKSVDFDMDKATQEIIDDKNKQIRELKEKLAKLES